MTRHALVDLAAERAAARWMRQARCRHRDVEEFFPNPGDTAAANDAKQFCAECPVTVECLEFALARRELFGIWGGTTVRERRRLRAERRAGAALTVGTG